MKKYIELDMELIVLQAQDVVTMSGFHGADDEFGNPNEADPNGADPNMFGN